MIANLLQRTHEVHGEQMLYRFGNGLVVKTEHLGTKTSFRILGLGSPQNTLLNYMVNFPDTIRNKDVFDPFAGSGVLGLMALKVGAHSATFLDINPRAVEFQTENARLNHFMGEQFSCHEGDIRTFRPERQFDWLFANPPFVPTPEGITDRGIALNCVPKHEVGEIRVIPACLEPFVLDPEFGAFVLP